MNSKGLCVAVGGASSAGRKPINQDAFAAVVPGPTALNAKGVAAAIADGISSSRVSQEASQTAVAAFLDDYYCTPEAWSVKTSAYRVINAINGWLHGQSNQGPSRLDRDRGYVCTFSAVVFKSTTAHIFHAGDTRIYRLAGTGLEQLTSDHRKVVDSQTSYLSRALGTELTIDVDYQSFALEVGDLWLMTSDGVHEFFDPKAVAARLGTERDLEAAARAIVNEALAAGSDDNLTVQILRIDSLPEPSREEVLESAERRRPPPPLAPRMVFEGYEIMREIAISPRSHVVLAKDQQNGQQVVIKTASAETRETAHWQDALLMEEWVGHRVRNPHVLQLIQSQRPRQYVYLVTEYIDGQTLAQWCRDHPTPKLDKVREIAEQVARGLQAFHRLEIIHQDIRPNNIMIDRYGTVKIIDFGACYVPGLAEREAVSPLREIPGTVSFCAPEYFAGTEVSTRSDIYSFGAMVYYLLSGRLPYGNQIAKVTAPRGLHKLKYQSLRLHRPDLPQWVDDALQKATRVEPWRRQGDVLELAFDLKRPNDEFVRRSKPPLLERDPVVFWQCVSALLLIVCLVLASRF